MKYFGIGTAAQQDWASNKNEKRIINHLGVYQYCFIFIYVVGILTKMIPRYHFSMKRKQATVQKV